MAKDLETIVRISGNLEASLRKAVEAASRKIGELDAAAQRSSDAVDKLSGVMDDQSDTLKAAKKQYAAYVLSGEEGSKQAKDLAKKIRALSDDLEQNKSRLKAAEDAADRLTGSLDNAGDAAKDTGDAAKGSKEGFTVMKGAIANLISSGIQALVSKCADAVKSIYGLAESTREYREDMGKLETAWESAGKPAEYAKQAYTEFYAALGEEDRSVEAVNHLAKFVDTQEDLTKWTNIATGVWGTFGDSLPVEGLTEAANETIKVGQLTGVLADALNWAGVNEDAFQKSLDKCSTAQDRAVLVTDTLNGLYSEAADNYRENNASIIDARKAQSDYNDVLADIGERIEPVTTAVKTGLTGLLQAGLELLDGVDLEAFTEKIAEGFEWVNDTIVPIVKSTVPKLIDRFSNMADTFVPIIEDVFPVLVDTIGQVRGAFEPLLPIIGEAAMTLLPAIGTAVGQIVSAVAPFLPMLAQMIGELLPPLVYLVMGLLPPLIQIVQAVLPVVQEIITDLVPPLIQIVEAILPVIVSIIEALLPALEPVMDLFLTLLNDFVLPLMEPITKLVQALLPAIAPIIEVITSCLEPLLAILEPILDVLGGIIGFIGKVVGWVSQGLSWVVDLVFGGTGEIDAAASANGYATGGFTSGLSIAGEDPRYPMEAVISFNPAYREANLGYWARAGRLLGATADDAGFSLSGDSYSNSTVIDMGGVTFAPNINISGSADKQSVVKAIEDEYPEFLDMLENWLYERGLPVFG